MENELDTSEGIEKYMDDANLESLGASEDSESVDSIEQPNAENESDELSLDSFEVESEGADLLGQINDLGILRNGLPVNFENMDQIREMLSKGWDYTQKTQELSDFRKHAEMELSKERESFAQEREAFEAEKSQFANNQLYLDAFLRMVDDIKVSDPSLYDELDAVFIKHERDVFGMHNNPALSAYDKRIQELEAKLAEKDQNAIAEQDSNTLKEWEDGLKEYQTKNAAKLRALGVVVDYKTVQDTWGADKTGKMTVSQAVHAVYGDAIQKALEAKAKLGVTKKKTAERSNTDTAQKNDETLYQEQPNSYMKRLEELAKKYAS